MNTSNKAIVEQLELMANLLKIQGANSFRVRAYVQASEIIATMTERLDEKVKKEEDLSQLKGIGKNIAEKIESFVKTGKIPQLEKLKKEVPPELIKLTGIAGLGPKRVGQLYEKLGVTSLASLKKMLDTGKIEELEGFGEKLVSQIKADIDRATSEQARLFWSEAEQQIKPLIAYLKKNSHIKKIEVAGSFRRKKETVGDFDVLTTADKPTAIMTYFTEYDECQKVVLKGDTRSTIILKSGVQVDLRVVEPKSFGAALQYFTGSKQHNITLRSAAIKQGYKLNEYGLYKKKTQVDASEETTIYKTLGLNWVPPVLREDRGELDSTKNKQLPNLITLKDIKGDFQSHTTASDGKNSLQEMAEAAQKVGREYLVITDHSKYIGVTNGQTGKEVLAQKKEIEKINQQFKQFRLVSGIEVDIKPDGSLVIEDEILEQLDFVVAAVHSHFNLSEEEQTKRIIAAIENPHVDLIAHPTGRIIGQRAGYQVNIPKIVEAAASNYTALELNSHPSRLDLDDSYCLYAQQQGVKIALSTDAHIVSGLEMMRFGVNQAQRAWLTKDAVLNSFSWKELQKYLNQR